MTCHVIIAAGQASGGEVLAGLALITVAVGASLLASVARGPANYHVVTKGGAPYCPRCNRQVSYRRDYCRSCGYRFVSYGPTPDEAAVADRIAAIAALERRRKAERRRQQFELWRERRQQRRAERVLRREEERLLRRRERDEYYLEQGIKPGPLAWYHAQHDVVQAILLGAALAIVPVLVLVLLVRFGS